jgi:hypothetical protein
MSTIFPLSASAGQSFSPYIFDGSSWNIDNSIFAEYLDESTASATYLTKTSASSIYATKTELNNIDLSSASAAAVAAIVDSAPSTLNTLNELAAALGDDANYASTITTALGNKLDISTASSTYLTQLSASNTYSVKSSPTFTGTVNIPTLNLTNALGYAYGGTGITTLGTANQVLKVNSGATAIEWGTLDALPSQTGNTGKYLTTNGSIASWGTLDLSLYLTLSSASSTYLTQSSASTTYAPKASPTFTGSVTTGEAITKTTSTVFTSSSTTTIATFPLAYGKCIAVECVVLISSESTGSYTSSKVLITADPDYNSIADITEYAIMNSRDGSLFPVLTATISGQNVLLRAAVSNFTATTAKVVSTSILSPLGAV